MPTTIELDFCHDDLPSDPTVSDVKAIALGWLREIGFADVTVDVLQTHGPAGGWPVIDFTAPDLDRMRAFVAAYDAPNGEVDWLLEGVRQS